MKKLVVIGLTLLTLACFTACGEEEEVTTPAVGTEIQTNIEVSDEGPMNEEQLQAFLAVFQDFMGYAQNFSTIYAQDVVAQNENYDNYVNASYALIDEITATGIEGLTYTEAAAYVATINEYTALGQEYSAEIKASLGLE